ncbi:MAG: polyhydroxybutyrate depolymerase [Myxococcaceae bacterium]|nr:polyhydroxybutyrate depolymerase [Myxococcaceae bacterium]
MAGKCWVLLCGVLLSASCGSRQPHLNRGQHALCRPTPASEATAQRQDREESDDEAEEHERAPKVAAAVEKTLRLGDGERSYRLFVPRGLDKTRRVPFVSIHHGFTMSAKVMERMTTWKLIAQREKFVVAFASGASQTPWNVGEHVCGAGARVAALSTQDDFGFVKAMVAATQAEQAIDVEHVFVGGFSMGGYFANHVACQGRDFVRAVAAHSAGTYADVCPGKPIPVLIIHGDSDSLIRYSCGQEAHDNWVTRNGCSFDTRCEPIQHGYCEWNEGCPKGQQVGMCTLHDMSHGWAGAPYTGPWLFLQYGGGKEFADAAELMWKFFAQTLQAD